MRQNIGSFELEVRKAQHGNGRLPLIIVRIQHDERHLVAAWEELDFIQDFSVGRKFGVHQRYTSGGQIDACNVGESVPTEQKEFSIRREVAGPGICDDVFNGGNFHRQ